MAFDLLLNGVGNAFSRRHWGTNFILYKEGYCLGIDCPDSYRRALLENGFELQESVAPLDVDALDGIFITHLHGDHVNGLEMVLAYRRYVVEEPLDVWAPPPVAANLWERRIGVALGKIWNGDHFETLSPEDFYQLERVSWEEPVEIGPFSLLARKTVHHLPAAALRVTDGDATVGYSCDTAYDESLIEWLSDADRILHETSLGPGHTPLEKLRELPEPLRRKMLVVHLPDALVEADPELELEFGEEGRIYAVET